MKLNLYATRELAAAAYVSAANHTELASLLINDADYGSLVADVFEFLSEKLGRDDDEVIDALDCDANEVAYVILRDYSVKVVRN